MNVLAITGGTGFIGRQVIPLALERGYDVRVLARIGAERRITARHDRLSVVRGKLTDSTAVNALTRGADVLIHLAAIAHSEVWSEEDRARVRMVNVGGAKAVFDGAREHGVRRIVIASSAHVYQGQKGTDLREDANLLAEDIYSESKIEVERLARAACENGLKVVVARPCLTYGPNVAFNLQRLMQALESGLYFHAGDRKVIRSFASVYSVAAALLHLAECGTPGEAYNVADREPMSLEDFTNDLADRMKKRRPKRLPYSLLWLAAAGFTALSKIGLHGPITLESLRKLTDSFSINTDKLAATGFEWPDNGERAREDMVRAYFAARKI